MPLSTDSGVLPLVGRELWATGPKVMLIGRHIHTASYKPHSFSFQQESLLKTIFALQRYTAATSQNSLPGQPWHFVQDLGNVTSTPGIARRVGDGTVGANPPARNLANHCGDSRSNGKLGSRRTLHRSR